MSGVVVVRSDALRPELRGVGEPIYYPNWFTWRWGQRFPEDLAYGQVAHHAVVAHDVPHRFRYPGEADPR